MIFAPCCSVGRRNQTKTPPWPPSPPQPHHKQVKGGTSRQQQVLVDQHTAHLPTVSCRRLGYAIFKRASQLRDKCKEMHQAQMVTTIDRYTGMTRPARGFGGTADRESLYSLLLESTVWYHTPQVQNQEADLWQTELGRIRTDQGDRQREGAKRLHYIQQVYVKLRQTHT